MTGWAGSPTAFNNGSYAREFGRGYPQEINKGRFIFPVDESKLDRRLPAGEVVLTVEDGDQATAFPLERIGNGAVNHHVGGEPVVVFARDGNRAAGAFSPVADGKTLTFDYRGEDQRFVDRETGSTWDAAGRATDGPLTGTQLDRLNSRRALWFSIAIALPNVDIYLLSPLG